MEGNKLKAKVKRKDEMEKEKRTNWKRIEGEVRKILRSKMSSEQQPSVTV